MWLIEGRMLRKPAWVARHVPPIPFILMGGESGSMLWSRWGLLVVVKEHALSQ